MIKVTRSEEQVRQHETNYNADVLALAKNHGGMAL